eukprot:6284698-Ditylum_brightwellii.AAC.1
MSRLKEMPNIYEFFNCPKHCQKSKCYIIWSLCGETGCQKCMDVGRTPHTPDVEVNGINLCEEATHFMTLPNVNSEDPEHYYKPSLAREHTKSNNLLVEDLLSIIPESKGFSSEEKKAVKARKEHDKKCIFHQLKVRVTAQFSCGALQNIYSNNKFRAKDDPTKERPEGLERLLENKRYTCSMKGTKGGRIVTDAEEATKGSCKEETIEYDSATSEEKGQEKQSFELAIRLRQNSESFSINILDSARTQPELRRISEMQD